MAAPSADSTVAPARRGGFARFVWWLFVLGLIAGAWAAAGYTYLLLEREQAARVALERSVAEVDPKLERFKGAVREVGRDLRAAVFQEVDLRAGGWQPIAGGFYVIDLAVSAEGGGVKIAGKIINPTSVTHDSAQLSARIGDKRAVFGLAHIPPAVAQPFEVVVPGVAPAEAKRAYFALESSTISFASSTTRKRTSLEPIDTDKALR